MAGYGRALMIKGPAEGSHITVMFSRGWGNVDKVKADEILER